MGRRGYGETGGGAPERASSRDPPVSRRGDRREEYPREEDRHRRPQNEDRAVDRYREDRREQVDRRGRDNPPRDNHPPAARGERLEEAYSSDRGGAGAQRTSDDPRFRAHRGNPEDDDRPKSARGNGPPNYDEPHAANGAAHHANGNHQSHAGGGSSARYVEPPEAVDYDMPPPPPEDPDEEERRAEEKREKKRRKKEQEADQLMMERMMGFSGFGTTKGQDHTELAVEGTKVQSKRVYRQYMNRRGGMPKVGE